MKITRIALRDFRGFAGPEDYTFDLTGAPNLLLFGENGSGKSSIFEALRGLFEYRHPLLFTQERANVFTETEDGYVRIDLTGAAVAEYRWDYEELPSGASAKDDIQFRDIARRAVFLDYRTLLQTHYVHRNRESINLFDLLVETLLRDVDFADGKPLSEHWAGLAIMKPLEQDEEEDKSKFDPDEDIKTSAEAFRLGLDGLLHTPTEMQPSLEAEMNRFLGVLSPGLSVTLKVGDHLQALSRLAGDSLNRFDDRAVLLSAHYGGYDIEFPANFLNEARLTAVALALSLAAAKLNRPPATDGKTLRLLVLDDVLIGLDLAHRLPLLKLLAKDFCDWQVLVFTYDQTWFEMARQHVDTKQWTICELYCEQRENEQFERPVIRMGGVNGFLQRAAEHLQAKDLRAAALYTRAAFEEKLRTFCSDKSVPIPFKANPSQVDGDMFLTATEARLKTQGLWGLYGAQFHRLRMVRKVILNPLSHSNLVNLVAPEVQEAIDAVRDFTLTPPEAKPGAEDAKAAVAIALKASLATIAKRVGLDPAALNDADVAEAIALVEKLQFDLKSERKLKPALVEARELTAAAETNEAKLRLSACLRVAFEDALGRFVNRKLNHPRNKELSANDLWKLAKDHKSLNTEAGLEFQKQLETDNTRLVLLEELDSAKIQALGWGDFKIILNTLEATDPVVETSFETKIDVLGK